MMQDMHGRKIKKVESVFRFLPSFHTDTEKR